MITFFKLNEKIVPVTLMSFLNFKDDTKFPSLFLPSDFVKIS